MCPGYLAFKMIWAALIFWGGLWMPQGEKNSTHSRKGLNPICIFLFFLSIYMWCLKLLCTKYLSECTTGCQCVLCIWCQPRHDALSDEHYVQEMVLEIICQLLHPSLLPFILQMLRQILNPGTVNPTPGVDSHNMMSLTKCPEQEETKDKPRRGTSKRFWVSTFGRTFLLCCDSSERKSEAVSAHDLTGLNNCLLTDWAQI